MHADATAAPLAFERPRLAPERLAALAVEHAVILGRMRDLADARRLLRETLTGDDVDFLAAWPELARLSCKMSKLRAHLRANRIEVDRSDLGVDA